MAAQISALPRLARRPEVELVWSCARTHLSAERVERARVLCECGLDWDHVVAEARRHGVDPLLSRHLGAIGAPTVPASILDALRAQDEANGVRNRLLFAELGKVLARLEGHGIPAMPYKGPVLAALAYGSLALRRFADLDVIVRQEDVLRAVAALRDLGYAPRLALTPAQERAYLAAQCEYALDRDRGRLTVEIHWGVAPPDFALRFDLARVWRTARPAPIYGMAVLVPEPEDVISMLVVHGSKHLWERLAWLVDVAELLDSQPQIDWTALLGRARECGGARMLAVALILAMDLLGAALPGAIALEARSDPGAAALAVEIARWLADRATPAPRSWAALRASVALRERGRDRAVHLLRTLVTPTIDDWASVRLPGGLLAAHYALRPFRLATKYSAALLKRPR